MKSAIKKFLDYFAPNVLNKYRRVLDRRRIEDKAVLTSHGFKFVGNKSMQDGTFEPIETRIILSLLKSSDLFVNIGANIGYYCCLAMQRDVRTIAIEPMPNNLQILQKNIMINGFGCDYEIFPLALGNAVGSIKMYGDSTSASIISGWAGINESYHMYVPRNHMDNILSHRDFSAALILMDIEGGEFEALQGATALLNSKKSINWVVEICIDEHQPKGVTINPRLLSTFEIFWDAGYYSYSVDDDMNSIDRECILKIIATNQNTLKTHNFLFTKKALAEAVFNYYE